MRRQSGFVRRRLFELVEEADDWVESRVLVEKMNKELKHNFRIDTLGCGKFLQGSPIERKQTRVRRVSGHPELGFRTVILYRVKI